MDIDYAPAREQDIETVFQLNKQLIDQYENVDEIDYEKVLRWVRRRIEVHITECNRVIMDGALVGYFYFHPEEGKMELDSLFVLPEYRSRGIGRVILQKCRMETNLPIFLYVFVRNTRAVAFYKRQGFQIVKAVGKTRYIMELS